MHHVSPAASKYALVLAISVLGGAVFLAIGQALVGLVKSADTVNAAGRILMIVLILLGLFGDPAPRRTWESAPTSGFPVGVVMNLYAGVLDLGSWGSRDWLCLVACGGYIAACGAVGFTGSSGRPADPVRPPRLVKSDHGPPSPYR